MYAIIKCVNGNYAVHSEGIATFESAKVQFHGLCQMLWNATDVISACVMITNENLDAVEGNREFISHAQPEPEATEE